MTQTKIAHVITRMIIGGAQENTLYSVEYLQNISDYECTLITGPELGPEGSLLERAKKSVKSLRICHFLRRNINPFYDIIALIHLYFLFRKEKYHIVHTHSSKAGIIARIAAYCANVPLIVHTIHGLAFHEYQNKCINLIYITLERFCALITHKMVTVCPEMKKKALAARIGKDEKYLVIYSGIETKDFSTITEKEIKEMKREYNINENVVIVGKIARLFELKGHTFLLKAAEKVLKRFPETIFLLVGDGILRGKLEAIAKEYGIEKNIIFTGLINPKDIPAHIAAMDIVVHLSLREGLARIIPQSFLLKKPVISYTIDGAADIIEDGKNGFLLSPEAIDEVAEKIIFLIENPEIRTQMGKHGKIHAEEYFPVEKMIQALDTLYQNEFRKRAKEL